MDMIELDSSWVHSVGYDGNLVIQFKDKRGKLTALCSYGQVSESLYDGLIRAGSPGTFVHSSGLYHRSYTLI